MMSLCLTIFLRMGHEAKQKKDETKQKKQETKEKEKAAEEGRGSGDAVILAGKALAPHQVATTV